MTDSTNPARARPEQPDRLSLSATQILASGLAAVSATVAASYFGVAGTVIGAGLGSVISVVGSAVYSYSIKQTHERVRQGLDVAVAQRFSVNPSRSAERRALFVRSADTRSADTRSAGIWSGIRASVNPRRLALASAALFLLVLAVTTGFELASGQPLAATVSGKHGSGTSLDGGRTSKPSPPVGSTGVPAGSATPSGTGASSSASPAPTVTVTVPASSTPASSSPGSDSPTSNAPSSSPTPAPSSTPGS
jgi:hypothetical protein